MCIRDSPAAGNRYQTPGERAGSRDHLIGIFAAPRQSSRPGVRADSVRDEKRSPAKAQSRKAAKEKPPKTRGCPRSPTCAIKPYFSLFSLRLCAFAGEKSASPQAVQQIVGHMQIPAVSGAQFHPRFDVPVEIRPACHQHFVLLGERQVHPGMPSIVVAVVRLDGCLLYTSRCV